MRHTCHPPSPVLLLGPLLVATAFTLHFGSPRPLWFPPLALRGSQSELTVLVDCNHMAVLVHNECMLVGLLRVY
jgi:hypothetical protein